MSEKTQNAEPETVVDGDELVFDPNAFDAVHARYTASVTKGEAPKELRRRYVTITIDHRLCRLDTYTAPVKVTLQELTSAMELRVLRSISATGDEAFEDDDIAGTPTEAMAVAMGKQALFAINGRPLKAHERDETWEILGMGGRLAAGMAFLRHGTGMDGDLIKKALMSVEIG